MQLPSSVTLSALKTKMQEVGDIKFAEITDEGKAIVRFHNAQDAERCVSILFKPIRVIVIVYELKLPAKGG